MKKLIKYLAVTSLVLALGLPLLRVNYYVENPAFHQKHHMILRYSVMSSLLTDISEGSFMTPEIIYDNIRGF